MLDNSFNYCINEKCSKKEKCLRFTKKENIKNGQTYIILTEEECSKNNCYIDKKEYYKNRSMTYKIIGDDANYIADISKIKNLD